MTGVSGAGDDVSLLVASLDEWPHGNTDFAFLSEVRERWPEHLVVMATDGVGTLPPVLAASRGRTVGLVVPPCEVARIAPLCRRVVELGNVRRLAVVMTMLVPWREAA